MKPTHIGIGEYSNYFVNAEGEVFTHNNNKLSKYAIPEKVLWGAAGHPYGYVIGESGKLYMLLGDNTTVTKIAEDVIDVAAYWNWAVVLFKDGSLATYKDGVRFSALASLTGATPLLSKVVQLSAAHYIILRCEDGTVWQLDWSSTPWKSGTTWYKSAAVMAALIPKQVVLPGKATWITTSRLFFSAAIVDGVVYAWGDSFAAKYFGWTGAFTPKVVSAPAKMTMVEASDHTLHAIDVDGFLYGQGGLGVGFVGDGRKESEVVATGGWPDMVVKTFVKTFVKISDRVFDMIARGTSYKFRNAARETNGIWDWWGYGKFGLDMTGIRPQDDSSYVGAISNGTPMRREIPDTLVPKTTAELKASGYPPAESPAPEPPVPVRKAIATLYDDGTWENIGTDE